MSEESVALSFQGIKKAGKKGFLKLGEYNMTSTEKKPHDILNVFIYLQKSKPKCRGSV